MLDMNLQMKFLTQPDGLGLAAFHKAGGPPEGHRSPELSNPSEFDPEGALNRAQKYFCDYTSDQKKTKGSQHISVATNNPLHQGVRA